jgi:HTH-type transcriptional regulator / antitoxin HigA
LGHGAAPQDDGPFPLLEREQQNFAPDWFSKPADSLLSLTRRRGIPIEAVANVLDGGMETIRALLTGTQPIDNTLANSLSAAVGGSPTFWLKRQASYERALDLASRKALDDIDVWLKRVPTPGGRPRGRQSQARKVDELRKRLVFYGVNSLRAWHVRYGKMRGETQFRTSRAFSSRDGALSLWLKQGELEAALTTTKPWDPARLQALLGDVLKLSRIRQPDRFLPKLRALGAEAGVAIVVVKAPNGCRASGASRLVAPEKAMVLLSFRHRSDDQFWFTLLHECGHLLLHGADFFVDADDTYVDEREREANDFARSRIIPPARWEEFVNLPYDKESVLRLSVSLGVAPGLLVGQLQHIRGMPQDRFNFLKRRWTWAVIEAALANLQNAKSESGSSANYRERPL